MHGRGNMKYVLQAFAHTILDEHSRGNNCLSLCRLSLVPSFVEVERCKGYAIVVTVRPTPVRNTVLQTKNTRGRMLYGCS